MAFGSSENVKFLLSFRIISAPLSFNYVFKYDLYPSKIKPLVLHIGDNLFGRYASPSQRLMYYHTVPTRIGWGIEYGRQRARYNNIVKYRSIIDGADGVRIPCDAGFKEVKNEPHNKPA